MCFLESSSAAAARLEVLKDVYRPFWMVSVHLFFMKQSKIPNKLQGVTCSVVHLQPRTPELYPESLCLWEGWAWLKGDLGGAYLQTESSDEAEFILFNHQTGLETYLLLEWGSRGSSAQKPGGWRWRGYISPADLLELREKEVLLEEQHQLKNQHDI